MSGERGTFMHGVYKATDKSKENHEPDVAGRGITTKIEGGIKGDVAI
jgi:hypothetical protein